MLRPYFDRARRLLSSASFLGLIVAFGGMARAATTAAESLASLEADVRAKPTNAIAAMRLGSALTHRDWLVPTRPPTNTVFAGAATKVTAATNEFPAPSRQVRLRVLPNSVELLQEPDGKVAASIEATAPWETVAWHPSSALVVLGRKGALEIRDGQTLARVPFDTERVDGAALAFSPDGLWLAAACRQGGIDLWDWSEGQLLAEGLSTRTGFTGIEFSTDGRYLRVSAPTGPVTLDARPSRSLGPWMVHTSAVVQAVGFPDRSRTLTLHADGTMRFWGVDAQEAAPSMRLATVPLAIVPSADRRTVATLLAPGKVRVWDTVTMRPIGEWLNHPGGAVGVAFDGPRRHVWTGGGDSIRCWEYKRSVVRLANVSTGAPVAALVGSPNAGWVAVLRRGAAGPVASWWPAADTNAIPIHEIAVGGTNVFALSPNSDQLLAAVTPSRLGRWDLGSGKTVGPDIDHGAPITFAGWSVDSKHFITVGDDHAVRVWDLRGEKPTSVAVPVPGTVIDAELDGLAEHLLVCGSDRRWRVLDVATGAPITESWPLDPKTRFPAMKPVRLPGARWAGGGTEVLVTDTALGARWMPLLPKAAAPAWLPDLAAGIAGEGTGDPVERIEGVRGALAREPLIAGPWVDWGRWWTADRMARPASLPNGPKADALVERGIALDIPNGLLELIRLDPSAPRLRAVLMEQMWTNIFWARPRRMEQAGWLRQRGAVDGK